MSRAIFEVWHTPASGGNTNNYALDVLELSTSKGLVTPKNSSTSSFNVSFANPNGKHAATFNYGDEIHIRASNDDYAMGTLIVGKVNDKRGEITDDGRIIRISGRDYSEIMLDNLVNQVYAVSGTDVNGDEVADNDFSAGDVVKHAITNFARATDITWDLSKVTSGGATSLPTGSKLLNNSAFPNVEDRPFERWVLHNKRLLEVIQDCTNVKKTGTREFQFYIEPSGVATSGLVYQAVYEPKPDTFNPTLEESNNLMDLESRSKISDRKNALIVYVGDDWGGDPYYTSARNPTSIGQMGWKWDAYNAGDLIKREITNRTGATGSAAVTTADINAAKKDGRDKAQKVVDNEGIPLDRYIPNLKGSLGYTVGNMVTVVSDTLGLSSGVGSQLRITEVNHRISSSHGWVTDLVCETDTMEVT